MFGALRMISVQQGYDPRDFALMGFGGAGPLHINAIARLMGSWPAVSPVSPGVLCALGDATTRMRTETARSFARLARDTDEAELIAALDDMAEQSRRRAGRRGRGGGRGDDALRDRRALRGPGLRGADDDHPRRLRAEGIAGLTARFDDEHRRLFTFNMASPHEIVNLRAVALGRALDLPAARLEVGDGSPASAKIRDHELWMDGGMQPAVIYDRAKLRADDVIPGPAIVVEMDSTTLIESGHAGTVDAVGNILIRPEGSR